MIRGKFNCFLDQAWGSSGKGLMSTYLADKFGVTNVSSANLPNAGHCQTAETVIITDQGMERLGDVVRRSEASRTINQNGVFEPVSHFVADGVRKTNLVKLANGVVLECTDEHRYYVWDSEKGSKEWVRSMDLNPETHQFLFPKDVEFVNNSLLPKNFSPKESGNKTSIRLPSDELQFAEYLGLLVGDGYYANPTRIDLAFHTSQLDVMERIYNMYVEMGITNSPAVRVGEKECYVLTTSQVSGLKELLEIMGLKPAIKNEKSTPSRVLRSNPAVMGRYLRGLFDADGSAKKDRVTLSNCAESVVRDAQQMLYVLGVHSSITCYNDRPGRTGSNRLTQWTLSVSGRKNLEKYQEVVGFASERKQILLNQCILNTQDQGQIIRLNRPLRRKLHHLGVGTGKRGNTRTSFVQSIKEKLIDIPEAADLLQVSQNYHIVSLKSVLREHREIEVFDLTVPGTHSYLANGCVSHNTAAFRDGTKFIAKAIPTAMILKKVNGLGMTGFISPGSGFAPKQLLKEWAECSRPRLFIHDRALYITEDHAAREREGRDSTKHIASTMQGSGTALSDKILRKTNSSVVASRSMSDVLQELAKDSETSKYFGEGGIEEALEKIQIVPAMQFRNMTHSIIEQGNTWLHEGSQGYALSIDHGSHYPNCTSRNCTLQASMDYMAVPPKMLGDVWMNLRTYPIRVGSVYENGEMKGFSGGFYEDCEELTWEEVARRSGMPKEEAEKLAERERTTVTKRIRRVSTFSWIGLRDAVRVNGVTKISVNFVQYLNWNDNGLRGGKEAFEKLSRESREFISKVEEVSGVPVLLVGTGALHDQVIDLIA